MKDPTTGRRQARLNPTREWLTHEVPSLRIIDDDLWHRAKARQMDLCFEDGEKTIGGKLNRRHRSQYLLSGLIKCGSCKSNFIIVGKDKYGCATRRTKGTCSNSHVLKRQDIEALVLDGLKEKLIEPEFVEAFIKEFNAEIARQGAGRQTDRRHDEAKLRDVEKRIEVLVSRRIAMEVEDIAELTSLGEQTFKGLHRPVVTFSVERLIEGAPAGGR